MAKFHRRERFQKRPDPPEDRRTTLVLAKLDIAVEKFYDHARRLEEAAAKLPPPNHRPQGER